MRIDVHRVSRKYQRSRYSIGFTILELLVCIVVISVLCGLLLPALARFRESTQNAIRLSALRSHAVMLSLYVNDNREIFPFPFNPEMSYSILRTPAPVLVRFMEIAWSWNYVVGPGYYPGGAGDDSFRFPGGPRPQWSLGYYYSANLVSRPEFWNATTRTGPDQWKPVRQAEVVFPSAKALVTNAGERLIKGAKGCPLALSLSDGSAWDGRDIYEGNNDLVMPYANAEGDFEGSYLRSPPGFPGLHTVDGVRGRDLKAR